jgi:hypothetical protein
MVTQDDVAAFEDVLATIDHTDEAVRDLAERLRRKEDWPRVAELRTAIATLGLARRKVQEQLR